jgi:hypothetical protein
MVVRIRVNDFGSVQRSIRGDTLLTAVFMLLGERR